MQITKFNIYGRIHSLYSRTHKKQEYDKEQLKADIEDAYHSQEITN